MRGATVVGSMVASVVVVDSKSGASSDADALQIVVGGNAGSRSSGASRGSFTGRAAAAAAANSGAARSNGVVVRGMDSRSSPTSFNYVRAVVKSPTFGDQKE